MPHAEQVDPEMKWLFVKTVRKHLGFQGVSTLEATDQDIWDAVCELAKRGDEQLVNLKRRHSVYERLGAKVSYNPPDIARLIVSNDPLVEGLLPMVKR